MPNVSCIIYATQCQYFDFKLRRYYRKIYCERGAYESIEDGSLSYFISRENDEKNDSCI